ncbi:MAG: hypothetical protein IPO53_01350 [Chitinophagaceae bacterium]|nr:hypothetical protein [Chitinophagaceae bacterium]
MKKIILALLLVTASYNSFSQTCEERESKLLETIGSFSAGMLYNTYGLIGSISDGYTHDAYSPATVDELMEPQKKVADNLIKVVEELINTNMFNAPEDKDYAATIIKILKGLSNQAQLLQNYTTHKIRQNQEAYENQRKQNWSAISKLMGIEE